MFKLDRLVIFTLVLMLGTLGMSAAAIAGKGNGPAPHATGSDVEFLRCHLQVQSWISFNAHEAYNGRPAKGELHYRDENGDWLDGDVGCVTIDGEDAISMAVEIEVRKVLGNQFYPQLQDLAAQRISQLSTLTTALSSLASDCAQQANLLLQLLLPSLKIAVYLMWKLL